MLKNKDAVQKHGAPQMKNALRTATQMPVAYSFVLEASKHC